MLTVLRWLDTFFFLNGKLAICEFEIFHKSYATAVAMATMTLQYMVDILALKNIDDPQILFHQMISFSNTQLF
jgi:hypothetical protein